MAQYIKKRYGLGRFLVDILLGVITGGLWWLFLLLRYIQSNR